MPETYLGWYDSNKYQLNKEISFNSGYRIFSRDSSLAKYVLCPSFRYEADLDLWIDEGNGEQGDGISVFKNSMPGRPTHYGVDIISNNSATQHIYGVPVRNVYARNVYAGTVILAERNNETAGNYVVVETNSVDLLTNKKLRARYLHLKEPPPSITRTIYRRGNNHRVYRKYRTCRSAADYRESKGRDPFAL